MKHFKFLFNLLTWRQLQTRSSWTTEWLKLLQFTFELLPSSNVQSTTMIYQGFISKSQHRFLTSPANPRPRHFYTLAKIHKPYDKWTIPNIFPPDRPNVSDCNSESAAVDYFIDYRLQPTATSIPSIFVTVLTLKAFSTTWTFITQTFSLPLASNLCIPISLFNKASLPLKKIFPSTLPKTDLKITHLSWTHLDGLERMGSVSLFSSFV